MLVRKAILSVKPEVVLTKNADGSYTFTINSTLKTQKTTFCIGGETTDERIDGAKVMKPSKDESDLRDEPLFSQNLFQCCHLLNVDFVTSVSLPYSCHKLQ